MPADQGEEPAARRCDVTGSDLLTTFLDQGFVVVPGVLTPDEVARARAYADEALDRSAPRLPGDSDQFLTDLFARHPDMRWILFHPKALAVWRELLGDDFAVVREASVHRGFYAAKWHADVGSQERAGHFFHREPDYLMAQTAFYLQDDSEAYGGGLEVVPGSHRAGLPPPQPTNVLARLRYKLGFEPRPFKPKGATRLWSNAGDMVLFDFRTWHRASPARALTPPPSRRKLAVFVTASRRNAYVDAYHDHLVSRGDIPHLLGGDFAYPADLLSEAATHGVFLP